VEQGTGRRAALPDRQVAGKTGTTQAARDAWFIGYSADYVAGVWMGYDDNTPLTGVTGGGLPAEIWREVMVRVHEGLPPAPLPMIIPEPRLPPQVQSPAPQEQIAPPSPPEEAVAQASPQENVVTTGQKGQEGLLRNVLNALSGNN
jgi:penicillin-binding protein 1A